MGTYFRRSHDRGNIIYFWKNECYFNIKFPSGQKHRFIENTGRIVDKVVTHIVRKKQHYMLSTKYKAVEF